MPPRPAWLALALLLLLGASPAEALPVSNAVQAKALADRYVRMTIARLKVYDEYKTLLPASERKRYFSERRRPRRAGKSQ